MSSPASVIQRDHDNQKTTNQKTAKYENEARKLKQEAKTPSGDKSDSDKCKVVTKCDDKQSTSLSSPTTVENVPKETGTSQAKAQVQISPIKKTGTEHQTSTTSIGRVRQVSFEDEHKVDPITKAVVDEVLHLGTLQKGHIEGEVLPLGKKGHIEEEASQLAIQQTMPKRAVIVKTVQNVAQSKPIKHVPVETEPPSRTIVVKKKSPLQRLGKQVVGEAERMVHMSGNAGPVQPDTATLVRRVVTTSSVRTASVVATEVADRTVVMTTGSRTVVSRNIPTKPVLVASTKPVIKRGAARTVMPSIAPAQPSTSLARPAANRQVVSRFLPLKRAPAMVLKQKTVANISPASSQNVSDVPEGAGEEATGGLSNTQMEILELEMRARAIKAMLNRGDQDKTATNK